MSSYFNGVYNDKHDKFSHLFKYAVCNVVGRKQPKSESFQFDPMGVYATKLFNYKELEPELSEEILRLKKLNPED
jgi:hypothetical protein